MARPSKRGQSARELEAAMAEQREMDRKNQELRDVRLRKMHAEGLNSQIIAERLGTNDWNVNARLKVLGLTPNKDELSWTEFGRRARDGSVFGRSGPVR